MKDKLKFFKAMLKNMVVGCVYGILLFTGYVASLFGIVGGCYMIHRFFPNLL